MFFKVDGRLWEALTIETGHLGWLKVNARPQGAVTGAHRCFTVPHTKGAFRTGGHSFVFDMRKEDLRIGQVWVLRGKGERRTIIHVAVKDAGDQVAYHTDLGLKGGGSARAFVEVCELVQDAQSIVLVACDCHANGKDHIPGCARLSEVLELAKQSWCEECGAEPGNDCSAGGAPRTPPHSSRYLSACLLHDVDPETLEDR